MQITLTTILATASALSGLVQSTPAPSLDKRYTSGQCGFHVQQYQKNEPGSNDPNYRLTIQIKDAIGATIGGVSEVDALSEQPFDISSQLPYQLVVTVHQLDQDPISFAYAGQNFLSSDTQCNFGAYDSGSRQGDCGFSC